MTVGTTEAIRRRPSPATGRRSRGGAAGGRDLLLCTAPPPTTPAGRRCCRSSRTPRCTQWTVVAAAAAATPRPTSRPRRPTTWQRVVEAIGRPVDVFGHSYGALVALEAALRSSGVRRLVLYEPALSGTFPEETARMERSLADGRREDVIVTPLRDLAGMTDGAGRRPLLPSWKGRVAAAHTVVRETRAEEAYRFDPDSLHRVPGADPSVAWQREPALAAGRD